MEVLQIPYFFQCRIWPLDAGIVLPFFIKVIFALMDVNNATSVDIGGFNFKFDKSNDVHNETMHL